MCVHKCPIHCAKFTSTDANCHIYKQCNRFSLHQKEARGDIMPKSPAAPTHFPFPSMLVQKAYPDSPSELVAGIMGPPKSKERKDLATVRDTLQSTLVAASGGGSIVARVRAFMGYYAEYELQSVYVARDGFCPSDDISVASAYIKVSPTSLNPEAEIDQSGFRRRILKPPVTCCVQTAMRLMHSKIHFTVDPRNATGCRFVRTCLALVQSRKAADGGRGKRRDKRVVCMLVFNCMPVLPVPFGLQMVCDAFRMQCTNLPIDQLECVMRCHSYQRASPAASPEFRAMLTEIHTAVAGHQTWPLDDGPRMDTHHVIVACVLYRHTYPLLQTTLQAAALLCARMGVAEPGLRDSILRQVQAEGSPCPCGTAFREWLTKSVSAFWM